MDLAEMANVHVNVIKKIETGKTQGWPITRERIAKALGCSVDELTQKETLTQKQMAEVISSLQNEIDLLKSQIAQYESPPPKPKK